MGIGWQQEVNIADSPIETGTKAPGLVLARPQYLVHVGKKCVDRPLRQRLKPAIVRPSTFALLRVWVPRLRVPCPLFLAVCNPTCGFALPRLLLASPTHVALPISRPIAEFEHVFSFVSGFIQADLHKHDTVQSSNNNHKILWSV